MNILENIATGLKDGGAGRGDGLPWSFIGLYDEQLSLIKSMPRRSAGAINPMGWEPGLAQLINESL